MLSKLVEICFVILLVGGVPALSYASTRGSQVRLLPRSALYFSAALSQWLLTTLGTGVMIVTSRSFSGIGFRAVSATTLILWAVLLAGVSLLAMVLILLLEQRGWWPAESELVYLLLPQTGPEKLWAVLFLAPTAAFCEEYIYRGYLLVVLSQWSHSVAWSWAISSAVFGLAHVYQGWSGMVRAALLGTLLAYPVLLLGSLYPSMVAHLLIDAVALGWLGPTLLRQRPSP
jgi:membrane protease YdiL (CAAX protease family)